MADDSLQAQAQRLLLDLVGRADLAEAAGTFELEWRGQPARVTVTADDEGPFTAGERVVRVLVEQAGRVGYAAGVHRGALASDSADGAEGSAEPFVFEAAAA